MPQCSGTNGGSSGRVGSALWPPSFSPLLLRSPNFRFFALLTLLSLLLQSANSIAYDSLYECENDQTGTIADNQICPSHSHYILELKERNDSLAKHYAEEHGMVVEGSPFLDSCYFLYHEPGNGTGRRPKRSVAQLVERPGVESLIVDRLRRRVKRVFLGPEELVGPLSEEMLRRQTTFFEHWEVPKLHFPDILYEEQWYLLAILDTAQLDLNLMDAAKRSLLCELIAGQSTVEFTAVSAMLATIPGVDLDFTLELYSRIWHTNAEGSQLLLKLNERNDTLAKYYAEQHGMIVKRPPFMESYYPLYDQPGSSTRWSIRSVAQLMDRPGVEDLIIDRPIRIRARDFTDQSQQTTFFENRKVPELPFPDPLYGEQWYFYPNCI